MLILLCMEWARGHEAIIDSDRLEKTFEIKPSHQPALSSLIIKRSPLAPHAEGCEPLSGPGRRCQPRWRCFPLLERGWVLCTLVSYILVENIWRLVF